MKHRTVGFEIKATGGDGSTGTGIANAFHNIDSYDEIVAPGAFTADLARFLEDGFVGGLNHDWDQPIGKATKAEETAVGLEVAWQISDTAHGKDVKILLKDKVIKKLSIGYRVLGDEYLQTSDDVNAYWQSHGYTPSAQDVARASRGGIRLLTRVELYEFSPVTVPANDMAIITGVKGVAAEIDTEREFERFLREAGFSKNHAKAISAKGYKAALSSRREADDEQTEETETPPQSSSFDVVRIRAEASKRRLSLVGAK